MVYELSWLTTLIVFVIALAIGIISAIVIRDGVVRTLWALLVALVFIFAGVASVISGYSWMYSQATQMMVQAIAVGAALTGIIYTMRAPR